MTQKQREGGCVYQPRNQQLWETGEGKEDPIPTDPTEPWKVCAPRHLDLELWPQWLCHSVVISDSSHRKRTLSRQPETPDRGRASGGLAE